MTAFEARPVKNRGVGALACWLPHRPGACLFWPRAPRPKTASFSGLLSVSVPQWLIYYASSRAFAFALNPEQTHRPTDPQTPDPRPQTLSPAPRLSDYIRVHPGTSGQ